MFNRNSIIVKSWVSLILSGTYTKEQVPSLGNLQEIVNEILNEMKGE